MQIQSLAMGRIKTNSGFYTKSSLMNFRREQDENHATKTDSPQLAHNGFMLSPVAAPHSGLAPRTQKHLQIKRDDTVVVPKLETHGRANWDRGQRFARGRGHVGRQRGDGQTLACRPDRYARNELPLLN